MVDQIHHILVGSIKVMWLLEK